MAKPIGHTASGTTGRLLVAWFAVQAASTPSHAQTQAPHESVWVRAPSPPPKGKRKGWRDLASGDAELNRDFVRSLTKRANVERKYSLGRRVGIATR